MTEPLPEPGATVKLFNANDGLAGRDGGPYLDQEEQRIAEERRAAVEGREPDTENPPASTGTVLVNSSQLLSTSGVNVPSLSGDNKTAADNAAVDQILASGESNLTVHSEVPAEAFAPLPESKPAEEAPAEEDVPAEESPEAPAEEDPFAGTSASE